MHLVGLFRDLHRSIAVLLALEAVGLVDERRALETGDARLCDVADREIGVQRFLVLKASPASLRVSSSISKVVPNTARKRSRNLSNPSAREALVSTRTIALVIGSGFDSSWGLTRRIVSSVPWTPVTFAASRGAKALASTTKSALGVVSRPVMASGCFFAPDTVAALRCRCLESLGHTNSVEAARFLAAVAGAFAAAEGDIAAGIPPARLRVIKVPHHGSLTSSTQAFLHALHPAIAIVSAGRANHFGHPVPEILDRYRSMGSEVFRTDQDGAVTLDTDGDSIGVRTFTGRRLFLH